MIPKNTICLWFDKDAHEAARFYAATFPDSAVTAVHKAPADYPSGKELYALRSVDAIVERARKQGEHVGELVDRLLGCTLPWTRMRQAYHLLRLCERFGRARVDEACRRALAFDVLDVTRIDRMLRTAQKHEDQAVERGKLVQLDLVPRFARPADAFATKPSGGEEGSR